MGINTWEDLRRKARSLENELDMKLVSFSKLGSKRSNNHNRRHYHAGGKNDETESLLNSSNSNQHMIDTMAMEIEQLLTKLTGTNDEMSEISKSGNVSGPTIVHTLTRHREILQDYNREFRKVQKNINNNIERENLLGSVRRDIDAYKSANGVNNRRTEMYLKEHEHLRNSDRLADQVIEIAQATKENIGNQRKLFRGITKRMNYLANRFPAINSLVQKVNLRKRRDTIILAGVISFCTILLLLYALH